jgi:hypothetical protein
VTDSPLVPVTTHARRLRHQAATSRLYTRQDQPGRSGRTLCHQDGFDQTRHDYLRGRGWWGKHVDITTLPACKKCARATNQQGDNQ